MSTKQATLTEGILSTVPPAGQIDGLIITKAGVIYIKTKKQAKKR